MPRMREAGAIEERMKRVRRRTPCPLAISRLRHRFRRRLAVWRRGNPRKAEKRGRVRLPMRRRPAAGELGQNGTPSLEQRGRQARQQGALPDVTVTRMSYDRDGPGLRPGASATGKSRRPSVCLRRYIATRCSGVAQPARNQRAVVEGSPRKGKLWALPWWKRGRPSTSDSKG